MQRRLRGEWTGVVNPDVVACVSERGGEGCSSESWRICPGESKEGARATKHASCLVISNREGGLRRGY